MLLLLRGYLRYTSWPIILAMVALMGVGVLAIETSGQVDAAQAEHAQKQMAFGAAALGAFVLATLIPYGRIGRMAYGLFALTLPMLLLVFAMPARNGSHRWIPLGFFDVQPSEIAKITYIIMLAWYLRVGDNYRRLGGLVMPFVLTLIPLVLILKEPDLGTSLLLLPTLYIMLFMAGARLRHLLSIVALATVLVALPVPHRLDASMPAVEQLDRRSLTYFTFQAGGQEYLVSAAPLAMMEKHQISRVVGWLHQDDQRVRMGKSYQLYQSKITLAAGGWVGRPANAEPESPDMLPLLLPYLPEDHTDFIFSVIGGKWGLVGCAGVLALYGVIFLFGIEIATVTNDAFGRLLAVGVLALLFSQIVINVGMAIGLLPVTGMTLPLVSYGGSSLLVNGFALGLLVNVGQHRPLTLGRRPFEHGDRRERAIAAESMPGR